MKLSKIVILLTLLLLVPFITFSQVLKYKITANDTYLGELTATRSYKDDITEIEVISKVKVNLFIKVNLTYKLNCTYKNNELLFSSVTTYVNGKLHSTSVTKKNEENYTITKDGHSSLYYNKINYSGALLYFVEPKGKSKIYSEFDNFDKPLQETATHRYETENPKNGHISNYIYKNGELQSSTIHHTLLTFSIIKE